MISLQGMAEVGVWGQGIGLVLRAGKGSGISTGSSIPSVLWMMIKGIGNNEKTSWVK